MQRLWTGVGALALGSTRARVVLRVVVPAAKTGIITAGILGVARVIGETAPLLLTALNNDRTVLNPFSEPIAALPTYIFSNVAQPYPDAVLRAWGAALTLMILVAVLFTLTDCSAASASFDKGESRCPQSMTRLLSLSSSWQRRTSSLQLPSKWRRETSASGSASAKCSRA